MENGIKIRIKNLETDKKITIVLYRHLHKHKLEIVMNEIDITEKNKLSCYIESLTLHLPAEYFYRIFRATIDQTNDYDKVVSINEEIKKLINQRTKESPDIYEDGEPYNL